MKKLLFIAALGLTAHCFGQRADTAAVSYCELDLINKGQATEGGIYSVSMYSPVAIDGYIKTDNGRYKLEVQPLGKLGAQGWHVVSYHATNLGGTYILEKRKQ